MGNKEEILPIRLTKIDEYVDNTEIIKLKKAIHLEKLWYFLQEFKCLNSVAYKYNYRNN